MVGKVINFPKEAMDRNRNWNKGYSDGYRGLPCQMDMPDVYYTGYEVGKDDREEDAEAFESGDLDMLTDEEAREIYGDLSDRP